MNSTITLLKLSKVKRLVVISYSIN